MYSPTFGAHPGSADLRVRFVWIMCTLFLVRTCEPESAYIKASLGYGLRKHGLFNTPAPHSHLRPWSVNVRLQCGFEETEYKVRLCTCKPVGFARTHFEAIMSLWQNKPCCEAEEMFLTVYVCCVSFGGIFASDRLL